MAEFNAGQILAVPFDRRRIGIRSGQPQAVDTSEMPQHSGTAAAEFENRPHRRGIGTIFLHHSKDRPDVATTRAKIMYRSVSVLQLICMLQRFSLDEFRRRNRPGILRLDAATEPSRQVAEIPLRRKKVYRVRRLQKVATVYVFLIFLKRGPKAIRQDHGCFVSDTASFHSIFPTGPAISAAA